MEDSVGETPTVATGTVALPRKSLMIGAHYFYLQICIEIVSECAKNELNGKAKD
jgi:hypothetical protein